MSMRMCAESVPVQFTSIPADYTGPELWDRLWQNCPSDAKDDRLLAREAQSPRWRLIVERLEATFGSIDGLTTIELGAGRGDLSVLLAGCGARVTLFDSSEIALDRARGRFHRLGVSARFVSGDMLGTLDEWRGRFDVSCSMGVVEHFRGNDRTRAIGAHHDVLAAGGLAVVSVPHAWCLPYRLWKFYLELRRCWPYGMEIPYTRREIVARARELGFARTETHCVGFWQSVGDHLSKTFPGGAPDWVNRGSPLDGVMGSVLLLFGWRGDNASG